MRSFHVMHHGRPWRLMYLWMFSHSAREGMQKKAFDPFFSPTQCNLSVKEQPLPAWKGLRSTKSGKLYKNIAIFWALVGNLTYKSSFIWIFGIFLASPQVVHGLIILSAFFLFRLFSTCKHISYCMATYKLYNSLSTATFKFNFACLFVCLFWCPLLWTLDTWFRT